MAVLVVLSWSSPERKETLKEANNFKNKNRVSPGRMQVTLLIFQGASEGAHHFECRFCLPFI
jgi:hypothetical protein